MITILDRIENVRGQVDQMTRDYEAKAKAFALPASPPELAQLVERLRDNEYTVMVMGEAKRGKTTFVNAVVGRNLLPTDIEVATSQVFRIVRAEQFACRLRFEDGSARVIDEADLPRYGSQVCANAEDAPKEAGEIIRWIEVDVPIKFLPDGISLLDTPGLGSVYAAHGRVTNRFVPLADGVLYVLDSDRPMVQADVDYITTVVNKTTNLFFIQTRIDRYDRDDWQTVLKRNQEILREKFADRLSDFRIWPISSTNLMKAVETKDNSYIQVSRFKQLSEALRVFLFRVGGLSQSIQAVAILVNQYDEAERVLTRQLTNLQEESRERRDANQRQVAEWQQRFQSNWGERGDKRGAFARRLRQLIGEARTEFLQSLQPGGAIDAHVQYEIDAAQSVGDIRSMGESINDTLVANAASEWERITKRTRDVCMFELVPLIEDAGSLAFVGGDVRAGGIAPGGGPAISARDDLMQWFKGARIEAMATGAAGAIAGKILLAVGILSGPVGLAVAAVAAVGAAIWGLFRGGHETKMRELRQAQNELRAHVAKVLTAIRNHYTATRIGQKCVVDAFFDGLEEAITSRVVNLVDKKSSEARAQYEQLVADAALDQQKRNAAIAELQGKLRQWQQLGRQISVVAAEVRETDRELSLGKPAI